MSNLFDNVDEEEGDIFATAKPAAKRRDTTPDFFTPLDTPSEMNLFSPSRQKESLFEFEDEDKPSDNDKPPKSKSEEQDEGEDTVKEVAPGEDPLAFVNNEDEMDGEEEKEDFELIDPSEVPSVEEAEEQLEIVRKEIEKRKREEEEEQQMRQQLEEDKVDEVKVDLQGEEAPDGGAISRNFGVGASAEDEGTLTSSSQVVDKVTTPTNKDDKLLEECQQQISELTSNLQAAQAENGSLTSEVSQLREELKEEREKVKKLEETIKEKDAEIAALKEPVATTTSKPTPAKPSPVHRKPPLASTNKVTSVSSPRTSARLKAETEKKSVAETVKKFSHVTEPKKPSPPTKRQSFSSTRKSSSEKPPEPTSSKTPRQDSATSRKREPSFSADSRTSTSVSDKKTASPPKPLRTKARSSGPQPKPEDSPMISNKPQRNLMAEVCCNTSEADGFDTLDAIKLWEQKSGDKKETSPTMIKKPLAANKSTPVPSSTEKRETQENGENLAPAPKPDSVDSSPEKKDDEKPVEEPVEQQKSPIRQSATSSHTRQRKTESMIVPGTKSKRWTPPTEKCQVCKKSVYPLERLQADEKVYHKTCFRCSHCKKVVGSVSNNQEACCMYTTPTVML